MSPKSRHKSKKYTAQRRAQSPVAARSSVSEAGPQTTPTTPAARSTGTRAAAVAPITTSLNVGREIRTIGIIAGILLIALIVLALSLS